MPEVNSTWSLSLDATERAMLRTILHEYVNERIRQYSPTSSIADIPEFETRELARVANEIKSVLA